MGADLGFMELVGPTQMYSVSCLERGLLAEGCAPPKGKETWGPGNREPEGER